MTSQTFKSRDEIATEIAFRIAARLRTDGFTVDFGKSNVSCSAYVDVNNGAFKLRVSDHADYHGSDHTIRLNGCYYDMHEVFEMSDGDNPASRFVREADLGELDSAERETATFAHTEISDADMEQLVKEGVEVARNAATVGA